MVDLSLHERLLELEAIAAERLIAKAEQVLSFIEVARQLPDATAEDLAFFDDSQRYAERCIEEVYRNRPPGVQ